VIGAEAAGTANRSHIGNINGRALAAGSVNAGGSGPDTLDATGGRLQDAVAGRSKPLKPVVDSEPDDDEIARSLSQIGAKVTARPDFDVPDGLRSKRLHATMKVRVAIEADGSHTEEMVTSSGDDRMDRAVLDWMRDWKWESARQDGKSVRSTRLQKVTIGQE
jgi:TonB family protein